VIEQVILDFEHDKCGVILIHWLGQCS